ncbi:predicted protein [Lichtheimia corymbifera JMRC:FSU:9682]|uniref:Uncharacterized protein n=1 Tax=Lichtheimia corymbifera JMRC:FSU:9682 TaxID=1263082 RepID=A0A068SDQ3_9FUNG|nr:predicted protein [Lichtheimia corymbifera JMRC:FSU:9682]
MNGLHIHLSDMGTGITFADQGPSSETPAITKITIESLIQANGDTFADVGSVLKHHRKTIEDFCWAMDGENDNRDIYDIQYPQLKKLTLNKSGWWIPRNAPLLEELTLSSRTINNHPAVLDTIPPSLKTLELKLNEVPELVDTSSIKQYLLRFAQHSHLHELVIISPTMDNIFNVVDAICHLKQLQRFAIIITMRPDSSQQDRFLDQLARGCTNLSCLEIYCLYKGLSTHSINTLKQLGNLKQCSFAIDPTSDDGIWHALKTFPQLKCIRIYPAMPSHRMGIRRLKEKRPDMTVYLDQTFTRF